MEKNSKFEAPVNDVHPKRMFFPFSKPGKTVLLISYFASIPFFILSVVIFSLYVKYDKEGYVSRQVHQLRYQALPEPSSNAQIKVENSDARIKALDEFFAGYNSPLEGHARTIVEEADRYKIDYRLLPAIAMQESTLCKKVIKESYNCWGFGIHGGKITRFDNYDNAIKVITATLAHKYVQQGYVGIEEIVQKYTPSDNGRWASVVSMIMTRLKESL